MNVADTDNGWPPGSGLIQLNDVETVDPDSVPVLRFIWFEPNVIVLPDIDHEPLVPDVYVLVDVGLLPNGSTQVPFATSEISKLVGFDFNVSVPDAADSLHAAHGCGLPSEHWPNRDTGRFVPRTVFS